MNLVCVLSGHSAAPQRVAWAHHRFGKALVAAVGDEFVVWSNYVGETNDNGSQKADQDQMERKYAQKVESNASGSALSSPIHPSIVPQFAPTILGLSFAPPEYGPMFACACADGTIHIFSAADASFSAGWQGEEFVAVPTRQPCTAVSWSPCYAPGTIFSLPAGEGAPVPGTTGPTGAMGAATATAGPVAIPAPRLVSSSHGDRAVRVWKYLTQDRHWMQEHELHDLPPGTTCVRDVAWAPSSGLPFSYIAAGTEEGVVAIWMQDGVEGRWKATLLPMTFNTAVCRLVWSTQGTVLTVSCQDGSTTMWMEQPNDSVWECVHSNS